MKDKITVWEVVDDNHKHGYFSSLFLSLEEAEACLDALAEDYANDWNFKIEDLINSENYTKGEMLNLEDIAYVHIEKHILHAPQEPPKVTRVIIHVEGGCIQEIKANTEDLDVSILDEDELEFGEYPNDAVRETFQALREEFDNLPYSGF